MSKKVLVAEIIQLFKTAPEQAYERLISSGHHFHTKQAEEFWTAYEELNHESLVQQFPDIAPTFDKVEWLKLFYHLKKSHESEKAKSIEGLLSLNPDETSLVKSLFLCLELGDASPQPNNFPNYTEESLEAIKDLLGEILPKLKKESRTGYSVELTNFSNYLIKIQIDLALLGEFLDAFVWAGFELQQKENSKGFQLLLPDGISKEKNLFVLDYLKTAIKRDFKRKESQPKISEEEHFKKNDPKWKTQEGLATVFHSSNITVTSQSLGTTSLQVVDDSMFTDMNSDDLKKREEARLKMIMASQEQNFHFQFRQALSQAYQPNDEVDIHDLHLEIKPSVFVTLYDLLCVMSCLIARADNFRYFADINSVSVKSFKSKLIFAIRKERPDYSPEELDNSSNSAIVLLFLKIEKNMNIDTFFFVEHETVLTWLRKVEELKSKSEQVMNAMIELLSGFDSPLPFNPLYKVDGKYYFSFASCGYRFNLNRELYDNYISDKLFNPNNKPQRERPFVGEKQKSREVRFTNSLKELFKTLTPYVESSLVYGDQNLNYDFGDLRGEFDVIAYFEKENVIFPIQVKLSNVSPRSEKRKAEWIVNHIGTKGIKQVIKDTTLLRTKSGLRFVADKLNISSEIKQPKVYPLIVTDNFFGDHITFAYNEQGDYVLCVSYFELKHLLLNQRIHHKQTDWLPFKPDNAASLLIKLLEENSFWNFLSQAALEFKINKSLCLVNEDYNIEMSV